MLRVLKVRNKVGFIDGTLKKSSNPDTKTLKWERTNDVVYSWILGSIF